MIFYILMGNSRVALHYSFTESTAISSVKKQKTSKMRRNFSDEKIIFLFSVDTLSNVTVQTFLMVKKFYFN